MNLARIMKEMLILAAVKKWEVSPTKLGYSLNVLHTDRKKIILLLIVLSLAVCLSHPLQANEKYAALIIDSETGNVLHAAHANERRYPASLTKMMTLYLTFEALRAGKLTMDSMLPVSKKAASMPQTNLSLRPGDSIAVRDAIKALVIRSANDVAVVLGEKLAGSEWEFGTMMTQKARQLGMNSTVFRNASGLPDSRQYTTARDMAVLGMALRKHFPEYYPFFKTMQFSYKGRTYYTHNNIMKRLPGAEGMKTGYINASGFNLVASVTRNGQNIIGVVMGGRTAYTRDSHMITLIERGYAQLNQKGTMPYYADKGKQDNLEIAQKVLKVAFARIPKPVSKPHIQLASSDSQNWAGMASPRTSVPQPFSALGQPQPLGYMAPNEKNLPIQGDSAQRQQVLDVAEEQATQQRQFESVSYVASRNPSEFIAQEKTGKSWGIQVGAYYRAPEAMMAAVNASKMAMAELTGAKITISDGQEVNGQVIHRARLANMDETQARLACQKLIAQRQSCFVIKIDSGQSL